MAEIIWTKEAEAWLKDIHTYIAQNNHIAAADVINGIYYKVQTLLDFPDIGYKYDSESYDSVRIILYGHYRIAYLVESGNIYILGIFHGALDIEKLL